MANKFAFGLIAAGLLSAVGMNVYQAVERSRPVPAVATVSQPEVIQPEPVAEVAAPSPEYANEAERVKAAASDHMAQSLLERCEQDWLPSTCVQMRAELEAATR